MSIDYNSKEITFISKYMTTKKKSYIKSTNIVGNQIEMLLI